MLAAVNFEGVKAPTQSLPLITFDGPDSIDECKVMGDFHIGGFSKATLDFHAATPSEPAHARFHGNISIELPPSRPEIQRTGFAGWRTWEHQWTLFGRPIWDIDPYTYLAIRFKTDARKYNINLQTESIVPTDIHQHRLYARNPGQWETAYIKWDDFVRTNHGLVVEPQTELLRQKLKTVGISLTDRVPGPFDLKIAKIWATNKDIENANQSGQQVKPQGDAA